MSNYVHCSRCGKPLYMYNVGRNGEEVICGRCTMVVSSKGEAIEMAEKKDRESKEVSKKGNRKLRFRGKKRW